MSRTRTTLLAVGVLVLALGGVAMALWLANGSGSGRAGSLSAQSITVSAATGSADLYPGFTQGDLHFVADNPNPYPVTFNAFSESGITSSDEGACDVKWVSVDTSGAISLVVPANAVGYPLSIADVVAMSVDAPDGCQNQTFDVAVTLTGSQS